jgi:DNA modification methylase
MTTILTGDCRETLKTLPDASINCCVTSPPYWGLRDYGHAGQIGLEQTPEAYVAELVAVFREVRRVLRPDGTLWLNLGDSYGGGNGGASASAKQTRNRGTSNAFAGCGMPKQLMGIPWRVAFALQSDGWYLRQDIIWAKPNPMPESVTDRCTKSHEYIFLLSKSAKYYYDAEAIKEDATDPEYRTAGKIRPTAEGGPGFEIRGGLHNQQGGRLTRNKRSVWTVATQPYKEAHFATFPPALIRPCILAGCPQGGTVLDPFGGSGTTGEVSEIEGRNSILCELNPEYVTMAKNRTAQPGLFCHAGAQ